MNIVDLYKRTRERSVTLSAPLQKEDFIPQPVNFVSPPKWHLAHITWFFEEMILKHFITDYKIFDKDFSFLFNSYYQTIGKRSLREHRGLITRPNVDEVMAYRNHVDEQMIELLEKNTDQELMDLVILGINHEQQHQELFLTDLKYIFHCNPIYPVYNSNWNEVDDTNVEQGMLTMQEGIYKIGSEGKDFVFDNELGRHKVYLHDYEIAKDLVTNGAYLDFINDGGYEDFKYWLDEGWSWKTENNIIAPLYWEKNESDEWQYFTLAGLQDLKKEAILSHVSFYEANAFAAWKGMRLPTEFEWEAASHLFSWGKRWEWTSSAYLPYPNFSIAAGALGEYNGKFMVNQMVLRGASIATAPHHSRNTYRNFFHPHFQWQYSGIRLAK